MQARALGVVRRAMCLALFVLQGAIVACSVDDVRFSRGEIGNDAGADANAPPPPMHQISVELEGSGQGRVTGTGGLDCPGACSVELAHGSALAINAVADSGSVFVGWGMGAAQACSGTGECAMTVTAPRAITAIFTRRQTLDVQMTGSGSGAVTSVPAGINCGADCTETYAPGQVVTLTAAPAVGSTFAGWEGGGCTGTGTCAVTVDAAKMVSASFIRNTYELSVLKLGFGNGTVTSSPGGINCGVGCSAEYFQGLDVVLTATPASDSLFTGWGGGVCTGTGATCVVPMTQARSVTATFVSRNPVVSVFNDGTGGGLVFSTPAGINCTPVCSMTVPYGTRVTLTAVPHDSSYFSGWLRDECPGTGPCTFTVTDDTDFVARFIRKILMLSVTKLGSGAGTVTSSAGGIDCGDRCSSFYSYGHDIWLSATPMPGSVFSGWGGACAGRSDCPVSMTVDRSVTATFVRVSP